MLLSLEELLSSEYSVRYAFYSKYLTTRQNHCLYIQVLLSPRIYGVLDITIIFVVNGKVAIPWTGLTTSVE